ncbi:hypothetical protein [Oribacterium sp.]
MFQSVMDIREDTPQDILNSLVEIANKAFDNRAGKVENTSKMPYRLIYRGEDNLFSCLQLGMLALEKQSDFLDYVISWKWIDGESPSENEDILKEIRTPIN